MFSNKNRNWPSGLRKSRTHPVHHLLMSGPRTQARRDGRGWWPWQAVLTRALGGYTNIGELGSVKQGDGREMAVDKRIHLLLTFTCNNRAPKLEANIDRIGERNSWTRQHSTLNRGWSGQTRSMRKQETERL